MSVRIR